MFGCSRAVGTAPKSLPSLDMAGLIAFMKSDDCQSVAFLTGAGVSVAAGIPDFRSAGGMYDTLRPELLTASPSEQRSMRYEPTTVVSWDLFRSNPLPYLEVRRPFILGTANQQWKATLAHWFTRLVNDNGMLTRVFTQNIDGLDYQVLPAEKIAPVHGSIGTASCEWCKTPYPMDQFREAVQKQIRNIYSEEGLQGMSTPINCLNAECGKSGVKPDTVLYGRQLPEQFFKCMETDLPSLDLLFVTGTSLTVSPANSLPATVGPECVVVVVNDHPVGAELGIVYGSQSVRDIFLPGYADDVFLELMDGLGWLDQLVAHDPVFGEQSQQTLEARLGATHTKADASS